MVSRSRWFAWLLLAAFVGTSPPAAAQSDARTKSAARALADEGDALWDNGSYAEALDRFARAYQLVPAPTLALRKAECQEKLGRLVEASELYAEIANAPLEADSPEIFIETKSTAQQRLGAVRARLPKLVLQVTGPYLRQSSVYVDEREVQRVLWGMGFPVNPGTHTIELVRGELRVTKAVRIVERETKQVELSFPQTQPVAPSEPEPYEPEPAPPPPSEPASQPPVMEADAGGPANPTRTLGWVGIGVGAAGLAVGTMTGITAMSRYGTYESNCPDDTCPESLQDSVDSYNRMRTISMVSLGVGVVAAGAGVTILLTTPPDDERRESAGVRAYVGPGNVGMAGRF